MGQWQIPIEASWWKTGWLGGGGWASGGWAVAMLELGDRGRVMASFELTTSGLVLDNVVVALLGHVGTFPLNLEETESIIVSLELVLMCQAGQRGQEFGSRGDKAVQRGWRGNCCLQAGAKLEGVAVSQLAMDWREGREEERKSRDLHLGHDGRCGRKVSWRVVGVEFEGGSGRRRAEGFVDEGRRKTRGNKSC